MISKLIIHPDEQKREGFAQNFIKELKINKSHPDLMWLGPEEKLGMEAAKKIKDFLNLKPYQAKGQVVVIICAQDLTPNAGNALLKTLEEHPEEVNLLLGAQSEEQLLPTLLSRCQVINLESSSTPRVELKFQKEIEELQTYNIARRFVFIEKLKDKEVFLSNLTAYFRHQLLKGGNTDFLKDLIEAERWAKANVNLRAILEYLMLKIPQ